VRGTEQHKEQQWSPEALEQELANLRTRIGYLQEERRRFRRLGFSDEQMRLELRQLEKRKVKYEQALEGWRGNGKPVMAAGYPQVET
jgi:ABC-type uncharacterized transport system ATPase subunit